MKNHAVVLSQSTLHTQECHLILPKKENVKGHHNKLCLESMYLIDGTQTCLTMTYRGRAGGVQAFSLYLLAQWVGLKANLRRKLG